MTTLSLAAACVLFAAPASAGRPARVPRPSAEELLAVLAAGPRVEYFVKERVRVFPLSGPAQSRVRLVIPMDGAVRTEFYARRRKPTLLIESGPAGRAVFAPPLRRAWREPGPAPAEDPSAERRRLESLYEAAVSTASRVAKRPAWRLDLFSRADRRLRRSVWLDRETGTPLRVEDFRPDGSLRQSRRAARFTVGPSTAAAPAPRPEGLFATDWRSPLLACPSPGRARPCGRPDFPPRLPRRMPEGTLLFDIEASTGPALRILYTDGLSAATLAQSAAGSGERAPRGGGLLAAVRLRAGEGRLRARADGSLCLDWEERGRAHLLCGDLPEDALARAADSLEGE